MANIFLLPVNMEMFSKTVSEPVEWEVGSSDDTAEVRVWGVKDSRLNETFYEKMNSGDLVLFYNRGEYIGCGRVGKKFRSQQFSNTYWDGISAENLFTIVSYQAVDLDKETVNNIFGYKPNHQPQSILRVSSKAKWNMRTKYSSVNEFEKFVKSNSA